MSIFNLFKKRSGADNGAVTRRLIIDGASLTGINRGAVRPPDQLQILERYGNFSRREKIPLTVLFVGKKLREVDEKGRYRDVDVRYAETHEQLPDVLRRNVKSGERPATVVVTGAPDLVKAAAAAGVGVMRETTLRKAVDRLQNERGAGNARGARNRGGGTPAKKKAAEKNSQPANDEAKREPDAAASGNGINDLIDLV